MAYNLLIYPSINQYNYYGNKNKRIYRNNNILYNEKMIKIYVYFKNGNVYTYEVDSAEKAREHADKIWSTGYRVKVGNRHEWFGTHYIDKICWDGIDDTYLGKKYNE